MLFAEKCFRIDDTSSRTHVGGSNLENLWIFMTSTMTMSPRVCRCATVCQCNKSLIVQLLFNVINKSASRMSQVTDEKKREFSSLWRFFALGRQSCASRVISPLFTQLRSHSTQIGPDNGAHSSSRSVLSMHAVRLTWENENLFNFAAMRTEQKYRHHSSFSKLLSFLLYFVVSIIKLFRLLFAWMSTRRSPTRCCDDKLSAQEWKT